MKLKYLWISIWILNIIMALYLVLKYIPLVGWVGLIYLTASVVFLISMWLDPAKPLEQQKDVNKD